MRKRKRIVRRNKGARPPGLFKTGFFAPVWRWLCWVTNNELHPKHEVEFDVAFFIVNTITVVAGTYCMIVAGRDVAPFAALLVIEFTWALDTLRHNRTYIK